MAIPVLPAPTTPTPRLPAPRWAAAALAGAAAGALLLVAVGGPAPRPPRLPGDAATSTRAVAPRAPARGRGAALSRYVILLEDDTSGVYFQPEAPYRAP